MLIDFLLQGGMGVRFGNGRSRCIKGNIYSFYQELRSVARGGGHVMSETKGKRRGNEKEQKKKERLSIFMQPLLGFYTLAIKYQRRPLFRVSTVMYNGTTCKETYIIMYFKFLLF